MDFKDRKDITEYEGEPVGDGEYVLGQLSMPGYGRVAKFRNSDDLYEDMPVMMDSTTFEHLFKYVKLRDGSVRQFSAVVKDHTIVDVY